MPTESGTQTTEVPLNPWRLVVNYTRITCQQIITQGFDMLDNLGKIGPESSVDKAIGREIDDKCTTREIPRLERVLCGLGCGCCLCTACLSWIPFCASNCSRTHDELSTIDLHDDEVPLSTLNRSNSERAKVYRRKSSAK
eukprot:TRINITY_DN28212_c0_g1_i1.p1 TRINITY_DN28212_c0_g1~~TRINITY_DN28212_c0_g1_i1.p1  ORF type:complete len:140 (+),score=5.02 TRINITY_DN28212_c0_g1_i1:64-483(+)